MPRCPILLSRAVVVAAILSGFAPMVAEAQDSPPAPDSEIFPSSLYDPRLAEIRKASATWEFRAGPIRRVVDVVCIVPDLPTLLEAIATWDEDHYFPILLEDAEYTLKFLRAFRPSAIIRYPRRAEPIPADRLWDAALSAVGRSWVGDEEDAPRGDAVPDLSRPTPPGVVLSEPESPSLAGAVALAAGRFQPMIRWDVEEGTSQTLSTEEAERLANELIRKVAAVIPSFAELGDACDFVTLAGPWPYRYDLRFPEAEEMGKAIGFNLEGTAALDDLLGRGRQSRRWAYVGRLVGDERESLYRAMCALFLPPDSAVLFDTYDQGAPPWTEYGMATASQRLAGAGIEVEHVSGTGLADAAGWHRTFHPVNRARLVLINSAGNPTDFRLTGSRKGATDDIPPTDPAAVLMIHSFSASNPFDPDTVAGRWLANGAFVYFGSVNEPTLTAFRPPSLVADLIAEYLPFAAAVRQTVGEPFAFPWRLIYIGDPLYRLPPPERRLERVSWEAVDGWPAYTVPEIPTGPDVSEAAKLAWSLKKALVAAAQGPEATPDEILTRAVMAIRRDGLPEEYRPTFDALYADVMLAYPDREPWRQAYVSLGPGEVPPEVGRQLRASLVADLQRALDGGRTPTAGALWAALMRSKAPEALKSALTLEMGRTFEARGRLRDWQRRLQAALRAEPSSTVLRGELERIGAEVGQANRPAGR